MNEIFTNDKLITRIESAGPDDQRRLLWSAFVISDREYPVGWYERFRVMLDAKAYVDAALMLLEEPWFVVRMGERVTSVIFKGDRHDHLRFYTELQHREGGRLTEGKGQTQALALLAAILKAGG